MSDKQFTMPNTEGFKMPEEIGADNLQWVLLLLTTLFGNNGLGSNLKVENLEKEVAELKGKVSILERKI